MATHDAVTRDFYFPALVLVPSFEEDNLEQGRFVLARRLWETSTFDLATLATRHTLHLPYQLMDIFLARCNLEFQVRSAASLDEAREAMLSLRLLLYAQGVCHSCCLRHVALRQRYSRDSELLRAKLPDGMKQGITSDSATVEAWPLEVSLIVHTLKDRMAVSPADFRSAVQAAGEEWSRLESAHAALRAFGRAVNVAPTIQPVDQAILHVWSGLESLFPSVTTELSFMIALYLAHLQNERESRRFVFDQARGGYKVRSSITHGTRQEINDDHWRDAWDLAMATIRALLRRGTLPTEEDIIDGLLPE